MTFSAFRFVEMHRGHAEGTFYQYINKHINDDFQVIAIKGTVYAIKGTVCN